MVDPFPSVSGAAAARGAMARYLGGGSLLTKPLPYAAGAGGAADVGLLGTATGTLGAVGAGAAVGQGLYEFGKWIDSVLQRKAEQGPPPNLAQTLRASLTPGLPQPAGSSSSSSSSPPLPSATATAPPTLHSAAQSMIDAASGNMLGEGVGANVNAAGAAFARGFSRFMKPSTRAVQGLWSDIRTPVTAALQDSPTYGRFATAATQVPWIGPWLKQFMPDSIVHLTPGQATTARGAAIADAFVTRALKGGGAQEQFQAQSADRLAHGLENESTQLSAAQQGRAQTLTVDQQAEQAQLDTKQAQERTAFATTQAGNTDTQRRIAADRLSTLAAEHAGQQAGLAEAHAAQRLALGSQADQVLAATGGRILPSEAGDVYQHALSDNIDLFHDLGSHKFSLVDSAIGNQPVVATDPLRQYAQEALAPRAGVPTAVAGDAKVRSLLNSIVQRAPPAEDPRVLALVGGRPGGLPGVQQAAQSGDVVAQKLLDTIRGEGLSPDATPDALTFNSAQFLRSKLLYQLRDQTLSDDDRRVVSGLADRLGQAMDDGAKSISPDAQAAYRDANTFWRKGKQQFETDFLRNVTEQYPSEIASRIADAKPEEIQQARDAMAGNTKAWTAVQNSLLQRMLTGRTGAGLPSGDELLARRYNFGPERWQAMFGDTTMADAIGDLGNGLKTLEAREGLEPKTLARLQRGATAETKLDIKTDAAQAKVEQGAAGRQLTAQHQGQQTALADQHAQARTTDTGIAAAETTTQAARAGALTHGLQVSSTGSMTLAMRLGQYGAAATLGGAGFHLLTSGDPKTGGSALAGAGLLLFTPQMLGAVMRSPAGRQWLINGVKALPGSATATRAVTGILGILTQQGLYDRSTHTGAPPAPAIVSPSNQAPGLVPATPPGPGRGGR